MNWYHGPKNWSELERVLSGRPDPRGPENPHPGDGSDAPAWSRKRGEYTAPDPADLAGPADPADPHRQVHGESQADTHGDGPASGDADAQGRRRPVSRVP